MTQIHEKTEQEYEITISVKLRASGSSDARAQIHELVDHHEGNEAFSYKIDTVKSLAVKPADSGDMTSTQELDHHGGELMFVSPYSLKTQPTNTVYRWSRMTVHAWKSLRDMMSTTSAGKDKLNRDVSEVWLVHDTCFVWVKMFKAVNQK